MPRTNNPQPAYGRAAPAGPQKPVHKRATLTRLCRYLMRFRWWILLALALTLASNLLALLAPMLSGKAIDSMEGGPGGVDFAQVGRYALWMLVFYAASSALAYLLSVIMITISRKVTYSMRADIFNHLATLPVGYFDTHPAGDILSRISYDTDTINASLSTDLVQVLASVVTVVGSLGMMLAISPPLVLVFGVTVPLSILITRFITSHTRPLFRRRSLKIGQLNGFVEEAITGQKTLTAYCQEENTIRKLDAVNDETVDAYFNAEYYSSRGGPLCQFHQQPVPGPDQRVRRPALPPGSDDRWAASLPSCSIPANSPAPSTRRPTSSASCNRPWPRRSGCSACMDEAAGARRRPGRPGPGPCGRGCGFGRRVLRLRAGPHHPPRLEPARQAGHHDGHRGPHRRGQDHAHQPAHAVLRRGFRPGAGWMDCTSNPSPARACAWPTPWCCRTPGCSTAPSMTTSPTASRGPRQEDVVRAPPRPPTSTAPSNSLPQGYDTRAHRRWRQPLQRAEAAADHCPGHAAGCATC